MVVAVLKLNVELPSQFGSQIHSKIVLVPEDGGATVKKVGCKVDHYRQLGQFLKNLSGIQKDFMKN